jgi:hypothetical protein
MKNVTLSADEALIERARSLSASENTSICPAVRHFFSSHRLK